MQININIDSLEDKILKTMNGLDKIEIDKLDGILTRIDFLYLFLNRFNIKKIGIVNYNPKKLLVVSGEIVPYMEFIRIKIQVKG